MIKDPDKVISTTNPYSLVFWSRFKRPTKKAKKKMGYPALGCEVNVEAC